MNRFDRIECALGDLVLERVDAIVNAANTTLRGGGGVDGAIHRAAGPELLAECERLYPAGCPTGDARITSGHRLPAKWVIHAVGPVYRGGAHGEREQLARCYRRSLVLAAEHGLTTISFPAISCGAYGYPWEEAAETAISTLAACLARPTSVERVRFVLFGSDVGRAFQQALARAARG